MPIKKMPGIVLVIKDEKRVFAYFFQLANANFCLFHEQLEPMKIALIYQVSMQQSFFMFSFNFQNLNNKLPKKEYRF